jgi:hypothetical protein
MAVFNAVHLTDLHFGSVPNRTNALQANTIRRKLGSIWQGSTKLPATQDQGIAERAAAWVYDKSARLQAAGDTLDALVLSGDLATTGLQADLDAALQYIDAPPVNGHFRAPRTGEPPNGPHLATIAGLAKTFLIPGNHDRYQNNGGDAGGMLFDQVFASYWARNTHGVIASILEKPVPGSSSNEVEHLALIGVDACLRQNSHANGIGRHWGQGHVYSNTSTELEAKTNFARARYPDIAVIWVVHFPPHLVGATEQLLHHDLIEKASKRLRVSLILSGHTHENHVYPAGAGSTIWNGGSATQFAESRGNWIQCLDVEIVKNRFVKATRRNYSWDTNMGDFQQTGLDQYL